MIRRAVLTFALALALLGAAPIGAAQTVRDVDTVVSETVTIDSNEWRAYRLSLGSGDSLRIAITVTLGADIDVYTTDATGYAEYADPAASAFTYYPAGSDENTRSFPASFSPSSTGTHYIVVDNAPISTSGAPGSAPVTVLVVLEKSAFPFLLVGGILLAVAVVLILVIVLLVRANRRKKMAMMPPTPPAAPVQGPWPSAPGSPPFTPPSEPPEPPQPPTPP